MEEFAKYLAGLVAPLWVVIVLFAIYVGEQAIRVVVAWKTYKRQVIFNLFHQERTEVIKQIFQKLTILHQALLDFTRAGHILNENESYEEYQQKLANLFNNAYVDARNYISLNRIYLSNDLCDKIENLISEIRDNAIDYDYSDKDIRESIQIQDIQFIKEKRERCRSIRDKVELEMRQLLTDLEVEFRVLISGKR